MRTALANTVEQKHAHAHDAQVHDAHTHTRFFTARRARILLGASLSLIAAISLSGIIMAAFLTIPSLGLPGSALAWAIFAGVVGGGVELDVYRLWVTQGLKRFSWGYSNKMLHKQIIRNAFAYASSEESFVAKEESKQAFRNQLSAYIENLLKHKDENKSVLNNLGFDKDSLKYSYRAKARLRQFVDKMMSEPSVEHLDFFIAKPEFGENNALLVEYKERFQLRKRLFNFMQNASSADLSLLGFKSTEQEELNTTNFFDRIFQKLAVSADDEKATINALLLRGLSQNRPGDSDAANAALAQRDLGSLNAISLHLSNSAFKRKLKWYQGAQGIAFLFAFLTGVGFGAISFTHVGAAILALFSIGGTLVSAPVWVLPVAGVFAIVSAVAYGTLMYYMLSKAIENNFLGSCYLKFKEVFVPKHWNKMTTKQRLWHSWVCLYSALALAAVISLSVLVTLGTAGAWSQSAAQFFSFVVTHSLEVIPEYAMILGNALILGFYLPVTVMFASENSLKSVRDVVGELWSSLKAVCCESYESIKLRLANENFVQWINPFRITSFFLERLTTLALVAFHSAATSMVPTEGSTEANLTGAVPTDGIMFCGIASEYLTDIEFVDGHEEDDEGEHDHSAHRVTFGTLLAEAVGQHHHHKALKRDNLGKDTSEMPHSHGLTDKLVRGAFFFVLKLPAWVLHSAANFVGGKGLVSLNDYQHLDRVYKTKRPGGYKAVPQLVDAGAGGVADYRARSDSAPRHLCEKHTPSDAESTSPVTPGVIQAVAAY